MAEERPPSSQPQYEPEQLHRGLPSLSAERLSPASLDEYYIDELRRSELWNKVLHGWRYLEYELANSGRPPDFSAPRRNFEEVLKSAPNPASEIYRFAATGQAFLPLFRPRCLKEDHTTEEKMQTYGTLGEALDYTLAYGREPDMGTVAELVAFALFLRPRSTTLLYPGSPREAMGHNTEDNHDAYWWLADEHKFPVEIKFAGVKASGARIPVLRVGHKIEEALAGQPLSRYEHDSSEMKAHTLHIVRLVILESQGETLTYDEYELLDTVTGKFDRAITEET